MDQSSLTDSLRETLAVFAESGQPWTTPEVAECLDLGRRTAYARLERLVEEGRLETKHVGANARVWWLPERATADHGDVETNTEGKPLAQQLRQETAFVESLLDTHPYVLYAFDTDGEFRRWNEQLRAATGYTDEELAELQPADFVADRAVEKTTAAIEQVLENGETVSVELPLVTADGEEVPYRFTGGPITDREGEVVGFTGIGRDVSDQKARERRLKRQRDELQAELEDVFTRIDEAFFAIDDDWRITYVNDRAADLVELSVEELLQARVWTVLPEVSDDYPRQMLERAAATQKSVEFEFRSDLLDTWVEVQGYPSETGLSVYVRDITDRKERERELEEYRRWTRTLVENFPRGAVALVDENLRYRMFAGVPVGDMDTTRADLEGANVREVLPAALAALLTPRYEAALDGESAEFEETIDGRTYQFTFGPVYDSDGDVFAAAAMSQDVTERRERERELELYETIVDTVEDGIYVLDEDFCFTEVNDAYVELTGYDREELLGTHCSLVVSEDVTAESLERAYEIADEGGGSAILEADVHRADGSTIRAESRFTALQSGDGAVQKIGIVRDVSERVAREQELEDRVSQQAVITDLGQRALADPDLDALLADAVELVADTLDTNYCEVLELDPGAEELRVRQGVGWDEGSVGEATVSAVADDTQAAHTLATEQPVIVEDLHAESRFGASDRFSSHDVRSGISAVVGSVDDPWGVLSTHDTTRREFAEQDGVFVQAVANVLAAAIDRHVREQELVVQREQLAALNGLNEVIRDITAAVIEQSTREEIEETVCERLVETTSYQLAWTGDVDTGTQTVNVRTGAGVEGYLDDVTISVDPDDKRSTGPTGRALRTGELHVVSDSRSDPRHDPWQEAIDSYGFRSSAAIPIVHEGTIYGVLNVYAERSNAFAGQEAEMVAHLGEIIGHAIAATERKQALMSDEVVELEFQVEDLFAALDAPADITGTVTLDQTVTLGDGEILVYGTATQNAVDGLRRLVETREHWESLTVLSEDDPCSFELRMTDPPVVSIVASRGGYIDEAVIEDGDLRMCIHLAPTVDVRAVIDAVTDAYPGAEMLRRRQVYRDRDDPIEYQRRLIGSLTDRQRTALEVAFHAGFFEWPRETSGEEVAEILGVAPPTFHQHLRKAERKVFDGVFSSPVHSSG